MTETEALIKLDNLLELLRDSNNHTSFNNLLEILKKKDPEFNGKMLKQALYQLDKDGFVYELTNKENDDDIIYLISIQGSIFKGYVDQKNRQDRESIRMDTFERELMVNRNMTLYLTILIAFGTLVAAIYYYFEIRNHHVFWFEK
jgi:hypothetical protein